MSWWIQVWSVSFRVLAYNLTQFGRVTMTDLMMLRELERKILWLATWMIHNANHLRDNGDGLRSAAIKRRPRHSLPS